MLPAAHRLRQSADFSAVVRRGRRAGRRHLVVHLLTDGRSGPQQGPALVGFVVARTVGGSVVRNRVERRLRHLAREHLAALPPGARAVVRANPAAAGATGEQLRNDLESAFSSALRAPERARRGNP